MSEAERQAVHALGRAALDGIDRSVNIWGDPANWGT
jgi:hypothetical protein